MSDVIDWSELRRAAAQAREHAYAPYSHYKVGAALLDTSGRIHAGANVENASYGLCLCAGRSAFGREHARRHDHECGYRRATGKGPIARHSRIPLRLDR